MQITKVLAFGRAARGAVFRVEVNHDVLSAQLLQLDRVVRVAAALKFATTRFMMGALIGWIVLLGFDRF